MNIQKVSLGLLILGLMVGMTVMPASADWKNEVIKSLEGPPVGTASNACKQFDGLWEGIDRDDGSTVQITIVCGKGSVTCDLIGRESYLNFCEAQGGGGEGWYEGTGQMDTQDRKRLNVEWTMYCPNGSTLEFDSYLIASGDARRNNILIYGGPGFQDITLYRVSK